MPNVVSELPDETEYVTRDVFWRHAYLVVVSSPVFFFRQQTRQNLSKFITNLETTFAFCRMVLVVRNVSLLSRFVGVIWVFVRIKKNVWGR